MSIKYQSIVPWLGGKRLLSKTIIEELPQHKCYVEVFGGAANVFFRKDRSDVEVINDINKDLINLYRCVQNHLEELVRYMQFTMVSREEFERLKKLDPELLTDVQRAARFYYLQKSAFGGRLVNPSFGVSKTEKSRFNPLNVNNVLEVAYLRLARVLIECLSFEKLIPRYDTKDTVFYLDPPYYSMEEYYGKGIFKQSDYQLIRDILSNIDGKFIMSINDVPEIRSLFKDCRIKEVHTTYSIGLQRKSVTELLVMNY